MRSRRRFLQQSGLGLGSVALSCLLQDEAAAVETVPVSLAPRKAPLPAKARHVIHILPEALPVMWTPWIRSRLWRSTGTSRFPGSRASGFPVQVSQVWPERT